MKLAHVTPTFPPYFGGTGNACYQNAHGLADLGHDVTVFTSLYPDVPYRYPKNMRVKRFRPVLRYGNAFLFPQLLSIKGFDLIHLHLPFHFGGEMVYLNSKARKIPYVVTYQTDVVGEGWLRHAFRLHQGLFVKRVVNAASKIIVSSVDYAENSSIADIVERRKGDVFGIPNSVDTERFDPGVEAAQLRERLGFGKEKAVLFVGALDRAHYFKGIPVLLKAFSKIKGKECRLLIVGDGDMKNDYIRKAKELGLAGRCKFTGRVSDEELPLCYALCDFLVLPSTDKGEAFGMVLAEAMASGKAVIASNLAGVRGVVDDGKNGLLAKPGDADDLAEKMMQLLSDEKACRSFGKAGRRKAESEFDWKKTAKKVENVYFEAVNDWQSWNK